MTAQLKDFLTRVAALPTHQDCPVDNHWLVVEAMELLAAEENVRTAPCGPARDAAMRIPEEQLREALSWTLTYLDTLYERLTP